MNYLGYLQTANAYALCYERVLDPEKPFNNNLSHSSQSSHQETLAPSCVQGYKYNLLSKISYWVFPLSLKRKADSYSPDELGPSSKTAKKNGNDSPSRFIQ